MFFILLARVFNFIVNRMVCVHYETEKLILLNIFLFNKMIKLSQNKKKIKQQISDSNLKIFELREIICDAEEEIKKEEKRIEELNLALSASDFFSGLNTMCTEENPKYGFHQ